MGIAATKMLRDLRKTFRDTQAVMGALHDSVQIKPNEDEVVRLVEDNGEAASFECRPVVCSVPERASSNRADVYVVFSGLLALQLDDESGLARTSSYATNFGYFKVGQDRVTHAFGGHYDFAESDIAHPRAHLQVRSQASMWQYAELQFRSLEGAEVQRDPMAEVLNRVRAPSAQMDFLSFMIQVAADHLIDKSSGHGARRSFKRLTSTCAPFRSYEVHSEHESHECHRAAHWYPQ